MLGWYKTFNRDRQLLVRGGGVIIYGKEAIKPRIPNAKMIGYFDAPDKSKQ